MGKRESEETGVKTSGNETKGAGQGDKQRKSPWREGKKPTKGEAIKNSTFFQVRKAGVKKGGSTQPDGLQETICLCCRERGHRAKHCPKNADAANPKKTLAARMRCYNCGEEGHSIHACSKPKKAGGALEFATCFVCKQQGHISSQCPQNERGIYPRGGACKICESVRHLAKDCPERGTLKDKKTSELSASKSTDRQPDELTGNAAFYINLKGSQSGNAEKEEEAEPAVKNKSTKKQKKIIHF